MKQSIRKKNQLGFALIATYLVVTVIAIFALAYFFRGNTFLQANERNRNKLVAFNMAEAAVTLALTQLSSDPNYTGAPGYVSMDTSSVHGGYTLTVAPDPDNPLVRVIQATGFAPDNSSASRAYQAIPIVTYGRFSPGNLFDFAIFAEDSITLTGSDKVASVDSYDSRNGPYDQDDAGSNGDIGVNSIAASSVTIKGKTIVEGDVVIGPGGDPDTGIEVGNNATITGTTGTLSEPLVYPAPSTSLPSEGAKDITNGTVTLMPGTYHYDSLKITGTGKLDIIGAVIIYVDGAVDILGNGIATSENLPPNLLIYVIGSETVQVGGNGAFYGGIYAPNSTVKNNTNEHGGIFGAVVSKNFEQGGSSAIHFDQAMAEVEGDQKLGDIDLIAWQEQNSLTWRTS